MTCSELLAELLIKSGLLLGEELTEAVNYAELPTARGQSFEAVLIDGGFLSQDKVDNLVQAQMLVKSATITREQAVTALSLATSEKKQLREVLSHSLRGRGTPELAKLLCDVGIIHQEQADAVYSRSKVRGSGFGEQLLHEKQIRDLTLWNALNALVLLKEQVLGREQLIDVLKSSHDTNLPLEQFLTNKGVQLKSRVVRLGELFVLARIVTDRSVMQALEQGLYEDRHIGEILVERGLVSQELLAAALDVQLEAEKRKLAPSAAAELLRLINESKFTLPRAMAHCGLLTNEQAERHRLGDLIVAAGLASRTQVEEAAQLSQKNNYLIGKLLVIQGLIDEMILMAALRCQFLVREAFLSAEQGRLVLVHCGNRKLSFDQALAELNIKLAPPA